MGWDENIMVKIVYCFHGFYVLNTILFKTYR